MINIQRLNPNWNLATDHRRASLPGYKPSQSEPITIDLCPCCFEPIQKEKISICAHSNDLAVLGIGIPIFYTLIKMCAMLLVIQILTESVLASIMNYDAKADCGEQCYSFTIATCDLDAQPITNNRTAIRILSFVGMMLGTLLMRNVTSSELGHHGERVEKLGSYSILVTNLPKGSSKQSILREFFLKYFDPKPDISEIFIIPNTGFIKEKIKEISSLVHDKQQILRKQIQYLNRMTADGSAVKDKNNQPIGQNSPHMPLASPNMGNSSVIERNAGLLKNQNNSMSLSRAPVNQSVEIRDDIEQEDTRKNRSYKLPHKNTYKIKNHEVNLIDEKIFQLRTEIQQHHTKIMELKARDQLDSNSAIIIINDEEKRNQVLEVIDKIDPDIIDKHFGWGASSQVCFQGAIEPREIQWDNLTVSRNQKRFRLFLGILLALLFISIIFVAFFFLIEHKATLIGKAFGHSIALSSSNQAQANSTRLLQSGELVGAPAADSKEVVSQEQIESKKARALSFALALIFMIHLFNKYIMGQVLHRITHIEKWDSRSQFEFSFALKYALGQFFTTGVMTIIVQASIHANYSGVLGLIDQETIILILSVGFIPLLNMLNVPYLWRAWRRWRWFGDPTLTQTEANSIMENPPYEVGDKYAEIIGMMWMTYLYLELIPTAAGWTLVAFFIFYWVDKYTLLRRSSIKNRLDSHTCYHFIRMLELIVILKPVGQLIFDKHVRSAFYIETIIEIAIAGAYLFVPWQIIVDRVAGETYMLSEWTYQEQKHLFYQDYRTMHPLQLINMRDERLKLRNKVAAEGSDNRCLAIVRMKQYELEHKIDFRSEASMSSSNGFNNVPKVNREVPIMTFNSKFTPLRPSMFGSGARTSYRKQVTSQEAEQRKIRFIEHSSMFVKIGSKKNIQIFKENESQVKKVFNDTEENMHRQNDGQHSEIINEGIDNIRDETGHGKSPIKTTTSQKGLRKIEPSE